MTQQFDLEVLKTKMNSLLEAFSDHPEAQPPTPNPAIFFMFDFIRTTNNQLKAIDAGQYAAGNGAAHDAVKEVVGRNNFANVLISDPTGKMASMMGGPAGGPINFGPEILSKANEVAQMQPSSM